MKFETLRALRAQLEGAYEPWIDNQDDPRNSPFIELDRRLLPTLKGLELDPETLPAIFAKPINTYHLQLAMLASLFSHVPYLKFGKWQVLEEAVYSVIADSTIHPLPIGLKSLESSGRKIGLPLNRPDRYRAGPHRQLMATVHTHPTIYQTIRPSVISEEDDCSYAGDLYVFEALRIDALRQAPASPMPYTVSRPLSVIIQAAVDYRSVGMLCFREGADFQRIVGNEGVIKKLFRIKRYLNEAENQGEVRMMLDAEGYRSSYQNFDWDVFFGGYPLFQQRQLNQLTDDLLD